MILSTEPLHAEPQQTDHHNRPTAIPISFQVKRTDRPAPASATVGMMMKAKT
jgi:hypothetical protein